MPFGDLLSKNPLEGDTGVAGHIIDKLNQLVQQDGMDLRLNLSADGKNYIQWSTANAQFEFYINDVLEGTWDAATGPAAA